MSDHNERVSQLHSHAGRFVLLAVALVLAAGVAVFGQWSHGPATPRAAVPHTQTAYLGSWWPYNSSQAPATALRFVGDGPEGTYFAGEVAGLSGLQVAERLLAVGWHSATILDGSRVVGGIATQNGQRFAWGASR